MPPTIRSAPLISRTSRLALVAIALCVAAAWSPRAASAAQIGQGNNIGIGIAAGSLSIGPSLKYYWARTRAVQAVLGYYPSGAYSLSVDALWEFGPSTRGGPGRPHFGIGPGVGILSSSTGFGGTNSIAAISLVLEGGWHFGAFPLELIIGWRPTWLSNSNGNSSIARYGSGAVRWYF